MTASPPYQHRKMSTLFVLTKKVQKMQFCKQHFCLNGGIPNDF